MTIDNQAAAAVIDPPAVDAAAATEAAGPAATRPARRANRTRQPTLRMSIQEWKPDDATTMIQQELEICSPLLRRNLNRLGVRAQLSLYLLQRVLPSSGLVEVTSRFDAAFSEKMDKFETALQEAHEELRVLARKDGIDKLPEKSSTDPLKVSVPIYSQGMGRFVRVIRNLDAYYCALDYLWMNGISSTQYQWDRINHFRRLLWDEVTFLNKSWVEARAILRERQAGRADARPGAGAAAEVAEAA